MRHRHRALSIYMLNGLRQAVFRLHSFRGMAHIRRVTNLTHDTDMWFCLSVSLSLCQILQTLVWYPALKLGPWGTQFSRGLGGGHGPLCSPWLRPCPWPHSGWKWTLLRLKPHFARDSHSRRLLQNEASVAIESFSVTISGNW